MQIIKNHTIKNYTIKNNVKSKQLIKKKQKRKIINK